VCVQKSEAESLQKIRSAWKNGNRDEEQPPQEIDSEEQENDDDDDHHHHGQRAKGERNMPAEAIPLRSKTV